MEDFKHNLPFEVLKVIFIEMEMQKKGYFTSDKDNFSILVFFSF